MPRGRKKAPVNIEEKIAVVEKEITELGEQLKAKKKELVALQKEKEANQQQKLFEAITASGKSYDEVIALLR